MVFNPDGTISRVGDKGTAILSDCERYRYDLFREWDLRKPCLCFIMLNPSTADHDRDDATIRKCMGFAARGGYGSIRIVNLFAWRATSPKELTKVDNPIEHIPGLNEYMIKKAMANSGRVVAAWGNHGKVLDRGIGLVNFISNKTSAPVYAFGYTKSGEPKHPLMLPYTTELKLWYDGVSQWFF